MTSRTFCVQQMHTNAAILNAGMDVDRNGAETEGKNTLPIPQAIK
jgi:hypothetical protein